MLKDEKSLHDSSQKEFHKALNKVAYEKANRNDGVAYFLEHFIKRSFASPMLMKSVINKLIPDLQSTKIDGELVDQSVNYKIEVVKLDGSKDTAHVTQKPINRMGE